ncbi:uncharacterized protein [Henckelia pumila]|uniref:uncharacterized protein n=1 Tax=Henckelia pumila TaxID=405737 RepID=UPI003C6E2CA9
MGGDDEVREPRQRHHRPRDDRDKFGLRRFVQITPNPLEGGESPDVAENWMEEMETYFERRSGQSVGSTNQRPRIPGQVYALSHDQVQKDNEEVIADTGASYTFVSARFAKLSRLSYIPLDVVLSVSTPTDHSALAKRLVLRCTLEFEGSELLANLMILAMEDFDCILGVDILTSYRATVDFYQKIVHFHPVEGDSWFLYGEGARPLMPLVSALRACEDLEAGGKGYFIHVVDTSVGSRSVEELPVVCEYPDVFPDDIPGYPPVREIEFGIELVPGTSPISRAPYLLAPAEMRELQQ